MQQIWFVVLLTSCSFIYNPDSLHSHDASAFDASEGDAPADSPYVDADPSMLHAADLQPAVIYEGQGVDNSRAAVLTIRGLNFVPGVTVSIVPTNGSQTADLTIGAVTVAADGHSLAVPVIANIMPTFGGGASVPLTITLTQASATTTIAWSETVLDELTSVAQLPPTQQRYSRVALAAAGSLPTGGPRALIHSMSSITLAAFHADALTTAAGPGGCSGGTPVVGACPGQGLRGTDGATPSAGGGAGFVAKGGDGGANTGGPIVGDPYVASYGNPANVASGGGDGGSTIAGANNGGFGGAGGGTLELHAEGDLTTAALTALGGAGLAGTGATGGGGAGGLVILRSGHTLSVASVTVTGGAGTTNAGSPGRIRVDAPLGSVENARAGASFATYTALITNQHALSVDLLAPSQVTFALSRLDQRGILTQLADVKSGTGTATVSIPLINGWNHLCLTVPGGDLADEVASECIDVAFMN